MLDAEAPAAVEAGAAAPATLRAAIAALSRSFRAAGIETAGLDARLLVLSACNLSKEAYILCADRSIGAEEARTIASYRERRLAHEPVSRIIGVREFWGRDFHIAPAVLDPRPDTETLVETALALLRNERGPSRILDLGTGSGCILLTLLAEIPQGWGVGVDSDRDALAVATMNARRLGLETRSAFVHGNWCDAVSGPFDLIVSNPPYIRTGALAELDPGVKCYDPQGALDGGADGLVAYRTIARSAAACLTPEGSILLEAGQGQAHEILRIFTEAGWGDVRSGHHIAKDLAGIERVVAIKRQAAV